MIRQSFLILMMLMIAGLGPALAQTYYNKPDSSADSGKFEGKPTLYNKIKPNSFTQKQSVVKYKDKLNVKELKSTSMAKVKILEEWQAEGMKPTNAEEILAYAQAHRAVAQDLMYQRRAALIKHLEKQGGALRPEFVKDNVSKSTQGAMDHGSASQSAGRSDDGGQDNEPQKKIVKKKRVFVKPENKALPTKVFKNYN